MSIGPSSSSLQRALRRMLRLGAGWGIRTRLLLLVLALLLPFLIDLLVGAQREADSEREHARRQVLSVAQLTSARLDDQVNNIYQLLATLSHALSPSANDAVRNDALLIRVKPSLPPQVADVSVWTAEGDNIASLDPGSRRGLASVAQRGFFQQALRSQHFSVEAPALSPSTGEAVAVFAMPMLREGRLMGVVSASMRLREMQTLLDPKAALPPGAVITIRDAAGVVLARSLDADKWIGKTIRLPGTLQGNPHRGGVVQGLSADGRERVAGLIDAATVPWSVYVGIPTDIALRPVQERLQQHLAIGGAMLLLGLMLAAWVADGVAQPLRQLGSDAAILGKGDLAHRSRVTVSGEAGLLAETLNRMAQALQERDAEISNSRERLRQVTDNMPALVSYLDRELSFRFANRAYRDWLGHDPAALIGCTLAQLYGDEVMARIRPEFDLAFTGQRRIYERELATIGGPRHVEVTLVPDLVADGSVQGLYVLMHDITARRDAEARLRQLAQYDSLTGLPNRRLFHDRLQRALARAQRSGSVMALMFVDIDHFKPVNDTHGHAAGDQLLQEIARRLQASVRSTDTVARLGGDEFTVILEGLAQPGDAQTMAERLVAAARSPVALSGCELRVSASIGIAWHKAGDSADEDGEALLRRADAALYRAKQRGRDGWCGDISADSTCLSS